MALSALDLFSVGIGPSSSHTVGPMRAAKQFADGLKGDGLLSSTTRVQAELFGSLGATGRGHGSDKAVVLGLQGLDPETVDTGHRRRPGGGRRPGRGTPHRRGPPGGLQLGRGRGAAPAQVAACPPQRHDLPRPWTTPGRCSANGATTPSAAALSWTAMPTPATGWWRTTPPLPYPFTTGRRAPGDLQPRGHVDLGRHARQRAGVAQRGGTPRGAAAHLGRHAANAWTTAAPPKGSCPAG